MRLILIVVVTVTIQLALSHVPVLQGIFELRPLSERDTLRCLALGLVPVSVLEMLKLLRRWAARLRR